MDKKSKLMLCKHCGQEIAVGAKSCPKCGGKNNKPIYKKWWFWAIILMIAIAAAGGSGSPDADDVSGTDASVSEGQENPVENDKSEEEPKVPTEYKTALKKQSSILILCICPREGFTIS